MDESTLIAFIIVIGLAVAVGVWMWSRNQRSQELRERFGPEYHHTVEEYGDRRKAETELDARRRRVEQLQIRPLSLAEYDQFSREWTAVQARFVDEPEGAIQDADRVVQDLMRTRGYPVGDFEQRASDISVDHPHVIEHYRAAHQALPSWGKGTASTEELRQAMVHYRALFDDLLEQPSGARSAA